MYMETDDENDDNNNNDDDDDDNGADDAHGMLEVDLSLPGKNRVNCFGEGIVEKIF